MVMIEPFLISPFFLEFVLPLVLIFTLIFAILQRTQLFGEDKKQIDAIVGIIVGLFLIAFPSARNIVVLLMPFLAISVVILFVFMLLYAFIGGKTGGDILGRPWKIALGAILAIALVSVLLMITGYWDFVWGFMFNTEAGYSVWVNGILIVAIAGAIIAVIKGDSS